MPRRKSRIVGKCYNCQGPVEAFAVRYVADTYLIEGRDGIQHWRSVRRLAHRGRCEAELRHRLSIGKKGESVGE